MQSWGLSRFGTSGRQVIVWKIELKARRQNIGYGIFINLQIFIWMDWRTSHYFLNEVDSWCRAVRLWGSFWLVFFSMCTLVPFGLGYADIAVMKRRFIKYISYIWWLVVKSSHQSLQRDKRIITHIFFGISLNWSPLSTVMIWIDLTSQSSFEWCMTQMHDGAMP